MSCREETDFIVERWIGNFRSVGTRDLSERERTLLTRSLAYAKRNRSCYLTGLPAAATLALFTLIARGLLPMAALGPLLALSALAIAIVPLQCRQETKVIRETEEELQSGKAEVFLWSGGTGIDETSDLTWLPVTGRIFSQDGQTVGERRFTDVAEISQTTRHTDPLFPARNELEGGAIKRARSLSCGELAELLRLVPRNRNWSWVLPAILWAWSFIAIADTLETRPSVYHLVGAVVLLAAAMAFTWHLVKSFMSGARIRRDLQRGTVIADSLGSNMVEHLPFSYLVWTVNSEPAMWRKYL